MPLVGLAVRPRAVETVKDGQKDGPLNSEAEPTALKQRLDNRAASCLRPEPFEDKGRTGNLLADFRRRAFLSGRKHQRGLSEAST